MHAADAIALALASIAVPVCSTTSVQARLMAYRTPRTRAMAKRALLMPKPMRNIPQVGESVRCTDCGHSKAQHSLLILQGQCQHCSCPSFNPRCIRCGHPLDFHTWAAIADKRQWQCLCACDAFKADEGEQLELMPEI